MKVYVKGKSKKEINERLAAGDQIIGTNFSVFGDGGDYDLTTLKDGTTISIFEKYAKFPGESGPGSPVAKSYGTWNAKTGRIR